MMCIDPFAPRLQDEPIPLQIENLNSDISRDSIDPAHLSVDLDVSGIGVKPACQETVRKE
jgi:hypothetical protein